MSHTMTKAGAIGTLALSVTALTGCSTFTDRVHHEATIHVSSRADLETPPAWTPADATDITSAVGTAAKDDDDAPRTMVFSSRAGVNSRDCVTVPRNSAPSVTVAEAPDVYGAKAVVRCGAWSLVSEKGRWIAWTPNTGDDAG